MTHQNGIIRIEQLHKTYRHSDKPALADINLTIRNGDKVGLVGPNGSGKTTLLKLIMNFLKPDSGRIFVKGEEDLEKAHRFVGLIAESQEGLENFTPRELFKYAALMFGMDSKQASRRAEDLLDFSGLVEAADHLIGSFSKGMAQRTFISLAIIHDPEILLLDEPMSGLDPQGQREVKLLLKKLNNKTLLYASHNLQEIEEFTTSVVFLKNGRIVHQLRLDRVEQEIFLVEADRRLKLLLDALHTHQPKILREDSTRIEIELATDSKRFQEFLEYCKKNQVDILRIRSHSILEEIYQKYMQS